MVILKKINKLLILSFLSSTSQTVAAASVGTGGVSTAFSANSTTVGVVLGSGSAFNDDYLILGVGVGYYVVDSLGKMLRFILIERIRPAVADITERATAGADITHDHEGRRAFSEALTQVRAGSFFTHGMQLLISQH